MVMFFDPYRELSLWGLCLRMTLAFVCGGLIGIEREYRRRPAGFRTHILICMGAAMTTLTSQFLYCELHYQTDVARLGAQVIAGIGFIGAGSIIVTRRRRVKGLTTAAGLWTTAIIGLAFGAGFYEGGLFATALILLAELYFSKLGYFVVNHTPELNFYVKCANDQCLRQVEQTLVDSKIKILNTEVIRADGGEPYSACAIFLLRLHKNVSPDGLFQAVKKVAGVLDAGEL